MGYVKKIVGIIMGSDSDLAVMSGVAAILDEFGIGYELTIISAHRDGNFRFSGKLRITV